MSIDDCRTAQPEVLPEEFFAGRLEGWAALESPIGGLQKQATIRAQGTSDNRGQAVSRNLLFRNWSSRHVSMDN